MEHQECPIGHLRVLVGVTFFSHRSACLEVPHPPMIPRELINRKVWLGTEVFSQIDDVVLAGRITYFKGI